MVLSGNNELSTAVSPVRWLIEHNEMQSAQINDSTRDGIIMNSNKEDAEGHINDWIIRHNTIIGLSNRGMRFEWVGNHTDSVMCDDFEIYDNIVVDSGGLSGRGSLEGTDALDERCVNTTIDYNSWEGRSSGNYGTASGSGNTMGVNNTFEATEAAIEFVDAAGGDYRLKATSPLFQAASDGLDVGADIDAIDAAIAGEVAAIVERTPDFSGTPKKMIGLTVL